MGAAARALRERLGRRGYLLLIAFASRLPLRAGYAVSRLLGRVRLARLSPPPWTDARVVRALGGDAGQVERWARRAAEIRESEVLESYLTPRLSPSRLRRMIRVEGLERLESALSAGRGAVLFSAHVPGRFTFCAALARLGHPPCMVGYPPGSGPVGAAMPVDLDIRRRRAAGLVEKLGCTFLWMEPGNVGVAVKAVNALRRNRVVVILVDVPHHATGIEVGFLGGRTRFAAGPALVARTAGAPMLDFFVHRGPEWQPQVAEIGEPFSVSEGLEEAVAECAARLEAHVRRHPPPPWKFFFPHPWLEGGGDATPAALPSSSGAGAGRRR